MLQLFSTVDKSYRAELAECGLIFDADDKPKVADCITTEVRGAVEL